MDAPYYNGAPGERMSDPEWTRLDSDPHPDGVLCGSCRATTSERWHEVMHTQNIGRVQRTVFEWRCNACWEIEASR